MGESTDSRHSDNGCAAALRDNASTCCPPSNSSRARPNRAQNSTWPAIERSQACPASRASSTRLSESFTGWLIVRRVAYCYPSPARRPRGAKRRVTNPPQVDNPMSLSFPNSDHRRRWWGGRPRPQPAPWPAPRSWQSPDSSRKERDEGVPCGPGGPPHHLCRTREVPKTKWHWVANLLWMSALRTPKGMKTRLGHVPLFPDAWLELSRVPHLINFSKFETPLDRAAPRHPR